MLSFNEGLCPVVYIAGVHAGTHTFNDGLQNDGLSRSVRCGYSAGTHTFNEGLSRFVHRGYSGTHTFNEGLSRSSVHRGYSGTHTFKAWV